MTGDCHVRICGSPGVRFPRATRPYTLAGFDLLLHRIGWSVQVTAHQAAERDEARIAARREEETWQVVRTAADLGRLAGRRRRIGPGLKAAEGPHLGPPRPHPGVRVTGSSNRRVPLAALIAVKPGCPARLIYCVHAGRRHGKQRRKGIEQLGGPIVVVWDNLNAHVSGAMAEQVAAGTG